MLISTSNRCAVLRAVHGLEASQLPFGAAGDDALDDLRFGHDRPPRGSHAAAAAPRDCIAHSLVTVVDILDVPRRGVRVARASQAATARPCREAAFSRHGSLVIDWSRNSRRSCSRLSASYVACSAARCCCDGRAVRPARPEAAAADHVRDRRHEREYERGRASCVRPEGSPRTPRLLALRPIATLTPLRTP